MKKKILCFVGACTLAIIISGCAASQPVSSPISATPVLMPTHMPMPTTPAAPSPSPTLPPTVDAVTSASEKESSNPAAIVKGMSKDGYWIFSILSDVTLDKELSVDGLFYDKDDTTAKIYRKLALYAQGEGRSMSAEYVLTVPKITVNSPNFRIQGGVVKGNVYVNAEGFELNTSTIDGNLVFASQELKDSAKLDSGIVKGNVLVDGVDAITSASEKESSEPAAIVHGMSKDGYWIFSILSDVTLARELTVDGVFHDKDDTTAKIYRKLALYAQGEGRSMSAEYVLTVPMITVNSPNFRIQGGVLKGDVYVNAEGFELNTSTIDGNLVFASQALRNSAKLDSGTVKGNISVK